MLSSSEPRTSPSHRLQSNESPRAGAHSPPRTARRLLARPPTSSAANPSCAAAAARRSAAKSSRSAQHFVERGSHRIRNSYLVLAAGVIFPSCPDNFGTSLTERPAAAVTSSNQEEQRRRREGSGGRQRLQRRPLAEGGATHTERSGVCSASTRDEVLL